MQIEEIAIDGFGRFHNFHIGNLGPGLIVIQGANEAGKSTLLAFIQRILFDFPSFKQKKNVNHYAPIEGGEHGGRLVLRDESGIRFVVERHHHYKHSRVMLPDGTVGSDEVLDRILGGAKQNVYTNIFAFGLSELEEYRTIESDEIKQALFNAAAGLGDISLTGIHDSLDEEAAKLFKSGGSKPLINSLLREIEGTDSTLRELQARTILFNEKIAALEEFQMASARIEEERTDTDRALARQNMLSGAWSDWQELSVAQEELATLPAMTSFPEDGTTTINRFQEGLQHLHDQQVKLEKDREQSLNDEQAIEIDESLLVHRNAIKQIYRQIESYRKNLEDLRETEERGQLASRDLKDRLAEIGDEWDEERLRAWGTRSGLLRLEVDQYEEAALTVAAQRQVSESALTGEKKDAHRLTLEVDDFRKQQEEISVSMTPDEVRVHLSTVTRLKAELASFDKKQSDLARLREQAAMRRETMPLSSPIPQWPVFLMGGAGVLVLFTGLLTGAAAAGAVAFIVMLAAAGVYIQAARRPASSVETDLAGAMENIQSLADLITTAERELSTQSAQLIADARAVGINRFPNPADLAQLEEELRDSEGLLKEMSRLKREMSTRETALGSIRSQIDELNTAIESMRSEEMTLRTAWGSTILPLGLDADASPKAVRDMLGRIDLARERLISLDGIRARVSRLSQSIVDFEAATQQLLDDCGRSVETSGAVSLDTLLEACEASADQMEKRSVDLKAHQRDRMRIESELEKVRIALVDKDAEIATLLSSGESTSIDEFLRKSKDWQQRSALQENIRVTRKRIRLQVGTGESLETYIHELALIQPEELRLKIDQLEAAKVSLAGQKEKIDRSIGQLQSELNQLESSQDQSKLALERADKMEQVHDRTRNWIRLMIAQDMLQKTVAYYEQERQPAVVRRASEYLQAITGGRYLRIQYPLGSSQPVIVEAGERQKEIPQLSRGLAEQVYLAIRFGYIDEYTQTASSLPVIFDDVLVNFDAERSRQACRAIGELACRHQVLYFTCHPATEAMLTEEVRGTTVVKLSDGTASSAFKEPSEPQTPEPVES
ncbi:AAA family ATPase [Methanosphaerula subterraneus]|uniref:AAA family ATPase n=1 Tax=Methanosphaerula subterraneus TaxID=3350244 RepID=UPI003F838F0E